MPTPSSDETTPAPNPVTGRSAGVRFDALDLYVAEAITVDALGVDDGPWIHQLDDGSWSFDPAALDVIYAGVHPDFDCTSWLIQAAAPLAVELAARVGDHWQATIDLAVDLAVTRRCDRVAVMVALARRGTSVVVDDDRDPVDIIAADFPSVELVELV